MQFFLCWGLYTSKLQISAFLKYNISLTSSVEYWCLRILGLLTLETRFLRADLIEVFKILRGFENLDPDRFFQVIGDGARRGTVLNCSRRGIVLNVRKFKFASMVCQEYASEHNRRFKFDWLFMNTFTSDKRIPKNEFRQTIETDNLNRLCSIPWVNPLLHMLPFGNMWFLLKLQNNSCNWEGYTKNRNFSRVPYFQIFAPGAALWWF